MTKEKRCKDCEAGEHENYSDDVMLTVVIDPDTKKTVKRCNLCGEHRAMYRSDGYQVEEKE